MLCLMAQAVAHQDAHRMAMAAERRTANKPGTLAAGENTTVCPADHAVETGLKLEKQIAECGSSPH